VEIGRISFAGFVVLSLIWLKCVGNNSGALCFIESAKCSRGDSQVNCLLCVVEVEWLKADSLSIVISS
jgi:hypothetical protein